MSNSRVVRMLIACDVHVTSKAWTHRHIEDAITTLMETFAVSSGQAFPNISVGRFKVRSYSAAYDALLGFEDDPQEESHKGNSPASDT